MSASVRELLTDSLALAEAQLEAARTLDAATLQDVSEARAELLEELAQVDPEAVRASTELRDLALQLSELDQRLSTVLEAALSAFRGATASPDGPATYTSSGQLRGGTP